MSVKHQFQDFVKIFDPKLIQYLDQKIELAGKINQISQKSLEEIKRMTVSGGKRLRPILVYYGYLMVVDSIFGQKSAFSDEQTLELTKKIEQNLGSGLEDDTKVPQNVLTVGLALEIFHASALIFDDIIDDSLTRRNELTIHNNFQVFSSFGLAYSSISNQSTNNQTINKNSTDKINSVNSDDSMENIQHGDGEYNFDFEKMSLADIQNFVKNTGKLKKVKKLIKTGIDWAILAGDMAHGMAFELVGSLANKSLYKAFCNMDFELICGQNDDCFGVGMSPLQTLDRKDVEKMLITKSGDYSIYYPFLMGALLALTDFSHFAQKTTTWQSCWPKNNPSPDTSTNLSTSLDSQSQISYYQAPEPDLELCQQAEIVQKLIRVSKQTGLVFQLTDDILGLFGNPKVTGKSNYSDLSEGKRTLLVVETWKSSDDSQKTKISNILGKNIEDFESESQYQTNMDWLKDLIKQKSLTKLKTECEQNHNMNIDELKSYLPNRGFQFLLDLGDFLLTREK